MKELNVKNDEVRKIADELKESLKKLLNTGNVKLAGWGFFFVVNDEMLVREFVYADGFKPEDFNEN